MVLKKIMIFLLVFAILVVLHYIFSIVKAMRLGEITKRNWVDYLIIGSAISYIVTIIFTGFTL